MTTDVNGDYRGVYTYGDERIGVEDLGEIEGKPNNPLYYLYDALGSMTAITNMNSGIIDSNRFAPYGEPQDPVAKNARHTNSPYSLTGESHDIEGDLVYLRARYYAPEMMRFIQQDSYHGEIENPLTRNLYIYGNDNPLKYVDPSGHMPTVPALIYLGETALETIPDILLDALIEGNNFKWYKSALANYGSNLIPGLGEAKTAKKLTKLTQKYGKDVATYFSKHPDDIIRNYKELLDSAKNGLTGIVEFIKKRANKFALDDGLGTYGSQGGHHPMAKSAFEGVNGYNYKEALSISKSKLSEFDVNHSTITGQQKKLYSQFSKTGKPLTIEAMEQIEIKAMINSGVPLNYAKNAVEKAIEELKKAGITQPSRIPWGK